MPAGVGVRGTPPRPHAADYCPRVRWRGPVTASLTALMVACLPTDPVAALSVASGTHLITGTVSAGPSTTFVAVTAHEINRSQRDVVVDVAPGDFSMGLPAGTSPLGFSPDAGSGVQELYDDQPSVLDATPVVGEDSDVDLGTVAM